MGDVGENYRISDIDFSAQSLAYVDVAVCMEKVCAIEIKFFVNEYLVTPGSRLLQEHFHRPPYPPWY